MSVVDRAKTAAEARERQIAEARERRRGESLKRTLSWWRQNFYRVHYIYKDGKHVEDPDNPFPRAEMWHVIKRHGHGENEEHPSSTWQCEGLTWICDWRWEGTGGDPAYWDDGWWPDFYVVIEHPVRWLPFLKRRREHPVWTPEHLGEVLETPGK